MYPKREIQRNEEKTYHFTAENIIDMTNKRLPDILVRKTATSDTLEEEDDQDPPDFDAIPDKDTSSTPSNIEDVKNMDWMESTMHKIATISDVFPWLLFPVFL